MKHSKSYGFFKDLGTGLSDGCLVLVTATGVFLSYQVYLQSALGY